MFPSIHFLQRQATREKLAASKAQQKVGSTRPYGCTYSAARLLYWAYFVPSK